MSFPLNDKKSKAIEGLQVQYLKFSLGGFPYKFQLKILYVISMLHQRQCKVRGWNVPLKMQGV